MAGPSEATRYADDIRSTGHVMEEVFRRKPYLQFLRGKSSPGLTLQTARDGTAIPAEDGRPLCTRYGPEKEAERILSGAQGLKRTQILVILGAGNPEIFRAYKSLLPGQICLILDHRLTLGGFYLQRLLETELAAGAVQASPGSDQQWPPFQDSERKWKDTDASIETPGSTIIEENPNKPEQRTSADEWNTDGDPPRQGKEEPISQASGPEFSTLKQYLNTPGCHLFFGEETLISLEHYLEGLPAENFQGIRFLRHRSSVDQAPDFYEYVEARMRGILQSRMSDLLTRFEFEPLWLRNTLINSQYARSSNHPSNLIYWQNRWTDKPALLVSAGPSLTETLPFIQKHQEKFFILACDTALKPLLRAGIRPHGAHILDAQKQTLLHFLNEDLSDLILFADLVCHPSLIRHLSPAGWIFSSTARLIYRPDGSTEELRTPGTELLEEICGPQGRLQSGGSVATSAFDLLRFLGFRTIYFAGQDLAWTFRQLHALNTHHYERWNYMIHRKLSLESINERVMQKRDLVPVPSVDQKSIPGDFILSLYRSWFEQSIESLKEEDPVNCINLSRSGSRIEGMNNLRMQNPLAEIHSSEKLNAAIRHDLLDSFRNAQTPGKSFTETDTGQLRTIQNLLLNLYNNQSGATESEDVWKKFPELRALIRKTEVYISRNAEKLSEERADGVYRKNLSKSLNQFLRFSSRYI
ncbi:MAG: DUF115 domain-containing protein [Leptospiraceae bacterium]